MSQDVKSDPAWAQVVLPTPKITYEEFLVRADENMRAEWVDGEVIQLSPASNRHQKLIGFLAAILQHFVETRQLGEILLAPFQMKTSPDLPGREPDLLFIAEQHQGRLKKNYLDGPADIAVEIISPDSRGRDRGEKFLEYAQGGVTEYWLIDPNGKQAEFYLLGPDHIYQPAPLENGVFRSGVLPGLWIQVDWLWQEPLPRLMSVLKEWRLI